MGAVGLKTHIWNNNWKSMLLLGGFPVLLLLLMYGLFLLAAGLSGSFGPEGPFVWAALAVASAWPWALISAGLWFAVAYLIYQGLIDASVGARAVAAADEPRPYRMLENLCISRGLRTPTLRVIETPALNAYASGLHEGRYSVTVTRGLLQTLDDAELEAVLAHELTHIINRDVRLLVIAVIFVGIFSFVFELLFRGFTRGGMRIEGGGRSSNRDGGGGGGAAALAIIAGLACIAVAYALAVIIRFSLSRSREYLADAGAVELTKNPDAMIAALRKIEGNAEIPAAPSEVREMFLENAHVGFGEIFATHPPISRRIEALARFAGGRETAALEKRAARRPWG
jgi:heat shock protein HtpX